MMGETLSSSLTFVAPEAAPVRLAQMTTTESESTTPPVSIADACVEGAPTARVNSPTATAEPYDNCSGRMVRVAARRRAPDAAGAGLEGGSAVTQAMLVHPTLALTKPERMPGGTSLEEAPAILAQDARFRV
jgi:hypothetical protein